MRRFRAGVRGLWIFAYFHRCMAAGRRGSKPSLSPGPAGAVRGSGAPRIHLRPGDPGHLFPPKPVAGSEAAPPSRHMATGGQPAQVRVSYSSSPTSLFSVSNSVSMRQREPPTYARVSNDGILRSVGQVVAGLATIGSGGSGPVDFAGFPPLGPAPGLNRCAGPLASRSDRYLPPSLLRQLALSSPMETRRCPARAWACGDARSPDSGLGSWLPGSWPASLDQSGANRPPGTWPARTMRIPRGPRSLTAGRRHPEGVGPGSYRFSAQRGG